MSFKSFLSAATTAISLFIAPVAVVNAAELTPGEEYLVESLYNAGVDVSVGECPSDQYYGLFFPQQNAIAICTNVATTVERRWMTLRHEAIHAAQRCIDPSMTTTAHPIRVVYANVSKHDFVQVRNHYGPEDWNIEYEAFTYMRRSNVYVANVLRSACNI